MIRRSDSSCNGSHPIFLANLCAVDATAVELIHAASAAGFDGVGALRVVKTLAGTGHSLSDDPTAVRDARRALDVTGMSVLDVEVFRLGPEGADRAEPLLEVAAELGAAHLLTMVVDDDPVRRAESVHALAALASAYEVVPVIEFMVFSSVRTLSDALHLTRHVPGDRLGVLVDALHLFRSGGRPGDLGGVDPARLPYIQINDSADPGIAESPAAALEEAVHRRLAPGDGIFPLDDLLARFAPGVPVSVEAPVPAGWDRHSWITYLGLRSRELFARTV